MENNFNYNKNIYADFKNQGKSYKLMFMAVVLVAVLVRVWGFPNIPLGVNQDEAMAAVDGFSLAQYGTDRYGMAFPVHLTAWGYGQMSALLSYLIGLCSLFFGAGIFATRLPLLIVSLFSLACIYLLGYRAKNAKFALILLFLTAISPWHIMQSRWSLDCNLLPHFLLFGTYFLYKGICDRRFNIYISMLFFGLSMYCYGIALYTVPLYLLILALYLVAKKLINLKELAISFIIYLIISIPFILCMAINFLKLPSIKLPFMTIPFFQDSIRSSSILFFSDDIISQFMANFKTMFSLAFLQKGDGLPWNEVSGFGIIYPISVPFVGAGIYFMFKKLKKSKEIFFVFAAVLVGIFAGLFTNSVNVNRLNIFWYGLIFLGSISIYEILKLKKEVFFGFILVFSLMFLAFTFKYFGKQQETLAYYFMKGFGDCLDYVEEEDFQKLIICDNAQYDNTRKTSEILLLFYHEIDRDFYLSNDFHQKYEITNMKNFPLEVLNGNEYLIVKNEDLERFSQLEVVFESYNFSVLK